MAYKNKEDKNAAQRRYHARNRDKQRVMMKKYYENNKDKWPDYETVKAKQAPGTRRWYAIKSRYGLTKNQYLDLLESQNSVCACCEKAYDKYDIDHDHACCPGDRSCGKCVRGIICHGCNCALGYIKEDPETVKRMLKYLKRHGKH